MNTITTRTHPALFRTIHPAIAAPATPYADITRRRLLGGAAAGALLVLGACADGETGTNAPSPTATDRWRKIGHELGTSRVPVQPERIVALGPEEAEILIALGLAPVGLVGGSTSPPLAGYVSKQDWADVELVGTAYEANLEAVAAIDPDVIVGQAAFIEDELRGTLDQIAPTIGVADRSAWKDKTRFLADLIGSPEAAEGALQEYEERLDALRERLAASFGRPLSEVSISVVGAYRPGEVNAWGLTSPAGIVLADLGFTRPEGQQEVPTEKALGTYTDFTQISLENLEQVDGDVIFVFSGSDEDHLGGLEENELWLKLDAVRENRVFTVSNPPWAYGSPLAAIAMLDDIEEHLITNE